MSGFVAVTADPQPVSWLARITGPVGVLIGVGIALLVLNRPSEKDVFLQQQLATFDSLGEAQQRVLRADEYFERQSEQTRRELRELHEYVRANPGVQQQLDTFHEWWTSLGWAEHQAFEQIEDPSQRIETIRQQYWEDLRTQQTLLINFNLSSFFTSMEGGRSGLPELQLSYAAYVRVVDSVMPQDSLSAERALELTALSESEDQILQKTIWLLRDIRDTDQTFEIVDQVADQLLVHSDDPEWNAEFAVWLQTSRLRQQQDPARGRFQKVARAINMGLLLKQATDQLGNRLQQRLGTDPQRIVEAFAGIRDAQQKRNLMSADPVSARDRLETMAADVEGTPESRIVKQLNQLNNERRTYLLSLLSKARQ
ncbi:MAG: hypothetical protein KDA85_03595 [Planctomycetaceae bacterium]|nr:hypothetical protein [Planctomycetaceae bacterium]